VLAPLFDDGGTHVVLTRRSERLRDHRGEVSFPGGRLDPGEGVIEAALREAAEEIALAPHDVEIIGALDDVGTAVSRSLIHPVVGVLRNGRPHSLRANPDEVDRVFFVPLADFVQPGVYHVERWGPRGADRLVHFFELADETVWGATARMMVNLLSIALEVADAGDR
jgi:8-oxo-dGTP pyrophosphatase MutT (NUDIX family)